MEKIRYERTKEGTKQNENINRAGIYGGGNNTNFILFNGGDLMSRFTFRNDHDEETQALMAYFSTKLGVKLSQNATINYVLEKTYERLKPFINAQKAQNGKHKTN